MTVRRVALAFAIALGSAAPAAPVALSATATTDAVTTLAGTGAPGIDDGPAAHATFVFPVALAMGPAGELYVADLGAQRIRMLRAGVVTTIAGGGALRDGAVAGAYVDGPALVARFAAPSGIAADRDGTLYVADRDNHCVRRIRNGVVDTLPGTRGFLRPLAIAIDASGTLYVADYGAGIRRIAPDGAIATLTIPQAPVAHVVGVTTAAAAAGATHLFVTQSDGDAFELAGDGSGWSRIVRDVEDEEAIAPWGIAAIDAFQFVAADPVENVVRIVRSRALPFIATPSGEPIAGRPRERGSDGAGFADGPPGDARFDAPLGVALAGTSVAVADAGNRRIRAVPLPNARLTAAEDPASMEPDPAHYHILFLSASYAFWGTGWDASIPGRLEARLARDAAGVGLPKAPRVTAMRIDAGLGRELENFAATYAADGQFDLVAVQVDTLDFRHATGTVVTLAAELAKSGTKLVVLGFPIGSCVAPAEWFDLGQVESPRSVCEGAAASVAADMHTAGINYVDASPILQTYDRRANALPLYGPQFTAHPSPVARALLGDAFAEGIEALHPWRR